MFDKYPDCDFDPRNLPDDSLLSIRLAKASSAQTENFVRTMIAGFLGVDEKIEADALFIYDAGGRNFELLRNNNVLPELPPIDRPRDHMNKAARSKRRKGMPRL